MYREQVFLKVLLDYSYSFETQNLRGFIYLIIKIRVSIHCAYHLNKIKYTCIVYMIYVKERKQTRSGELKSKKKSLVLSQGLPPYSYISFILIKILISVITQHSTLSFSFSMLLSILFNLHRTFGNE